MKPIRFFTHQQTVWYNLSDFIQLLLDRGIIYPRRPALLFKRKSPSSSIQGVLFEKINRLNPIYQRQRDGMVYIDWVIFEHLYRLIRPFLIHADDWRNPQALFRQLQAAIDWREHANRAFPSAAIAACFTELTDILSDDTAD